MVPIITSQAEDDSKSWWTAHRKCKNAFFGKYVRFQVFIQSGRYILINQPVIPHILCEDWTELVSHICADSANDPVVKNERKEQMAPKPVGSVTRLRTQVGRASDRQDRR